MNSIRVKIGVNPSVNFLNKLMNLFSPLNSIAYIETENGSRRVLAKSLIGLPSLNLKFGQIICISFYGDYAESDAKYIERQIQLIV